MRPKTRHRSNALKDVNLTKLYCSLGELRCAVPDAFREDMKAVDEHIKWLHRELRESQEAAWEARDTVQQLEELIKKLKVQTSK